MGNQYLQRNNWYKLPADCLTLTLFMFRVGTNDHNPTMPANYPALFANFFDRCSYFHDCFGNVTNL